MKICTNPVNIGRDHIRIAILALEVISIQLYSKMA